jgi:hypothetical protein
MWKTSRGSAPDGVAGVAEAKRAPQRLRATRSRPQALRIASNAGRSSRPWWLKMLTHTTLDCSLAASASHVCHARFTLSVPAVTYQPASPCNSGVGHQPRGQNELGDADCVVRRGKPVRPCEALNKRTWAEGRGRSLSPLVRVDRDVVRPARSSSVLERSLPRERP